MRFKETNSKVTKNEKLTKTTFKSIIWGILKNKIKTFNVKKNI